MERYTQERLRQEKDWDGKRDGDPWGIQHQLRGFIEREIKRVEDNMYNHGDRVDIYLHPTVHDDRYHQLTEQINKLASEADDNVEQPQSMMALIEAVNQLELSRHRLLLELIVSQVAAEEAYRQQLEAYEAGKAADDSAEAGAEAGAGTGAGAIPPPPAPKVLVELGPLGLAEKPAAEVLSIVNKWKLTPCPSCGGLLSTVDGARKLADHITGKMHLGFVDMRAQLRKLQEAQPVPLYDHPWREWGVEERRRQDEQLREQRRLAKLKAAEAKGEPGPARGGSRTASTQRREEKQAAERPRMRCILPADKWAQYEELRTRFEREEGPRRDRDYR
jgi:hypothetical protein